MKNLFGLCVITLSLLIILTSSHVRGKPFREDKLWVETGKGKLEFSIEIAETPRQQELGFMNRTEIPEDHGMLFIWAKDFPVVMWMKNTPLPLDMLFVDGNGKIVFIKQNAKPESEDLIDPKRPVRAVVELLGGVSTAKGIHVGDHVIHPYFSHENP